MIFIWGRKVVRRWIGYVADFCPVCRDLTRFRLRRVGMAGHFYYISLGEGSLISHERTCEQCGIELNARPEAYKSIARERLAPAELAATTRPDWQEAHAQRLALERHVATAPDRLPPDVRKAVVREPFELLAPKVEDFFARTSLDGRSWAAVGFLFFLLFVAVKLSNSYPTQFGPFFGIALLIGLAVIAWQVIGGRKRFFQRKVYPVLLRSLRPLRPTQAELSAAVAEMSAAGRKIGQKFDVAAFTRWTASGAVSSGASAVVDDAQQSQAGA